MKNDSLCLSYKDDFFDMLPHEFLNSINFKVLADEIGIDYNMYQHIFSYGEIKSLDKKKYNKVVLLEDKFNKLREKGFIKDEDFIRRILGAIYFIASYGYITHVSKDCFNGFVEDSFCKRYDFMFYIDEEGIIFDAKCFNAEIRDERFSLSGSYINDSDKSSYFIQYKSNHSVGALSSSHFSSLKVCNDYEVENIDEVIDNYGGISYKDYSRLLRINNFYIGEVTKEQKNKDRSFRDDKVMIGFVGYHESKLGKSENYIIDEHAYDLYKDGKISIYRLYALSRDAYRHPKERSL